MTNMTDKLRLLWLNWRDIKNPDAGGAEVFTHEVAKRLVNRGWSVTLFTSIFAGAQPEEELDGVEVIRRGGKLRVYRKAKDYCRKFVSNFDLVVDEINTRPFMTCKFVRTKPIVALIHQLAREYWLYEIPWPISWIGYYYLEKAWLNHYKRLNTITVSESTRRDLLSWGFLDVDVIPEGLSVPVVDGIPDKEVTPTLLFVGRLKRAKRPDHAIRAFHMIRRKIHGARLWVVGDGYFKEKLARMAGDDVQFMGKVEDSVKLDLMTRAHALLFPAVREGWGLSITEANARGTPAVAYDVPGVRDAVRNGETGLLVAPGDWRALAAKTCSLLQDQESWQEMASKAIEFTKGMSWDKTCSGFVQVCVKAFLSSKG